MSRAEVGSLLQAVGLDFSLVQLALDSVVDLPAGHLAGGGQLKLRPLVML